MQGPETSKPSAAWPPSPCIDVAVPVHNEEHVLERSVDRLHGYLSTEFPFSSRITIVDNASTDRTWAVATEIARRLPNVRAAHIDGKGRGRALRAAWADSDATVVAYMDVDLSTDLAALLPLVAPIVSGHSDLAIGSRLVPDARIARHPMRELTSRGYNLVLRALFATRVRDAQCGFKAVRADIVRALLPLVHDDEWFFDTELLLVAEANGLRIHQVPVDWIEDPDSRVRVVKTAWDDLKGIWRFARRAAAGRPRVDLGPLGRSALDDDFGRFLVSFATIGAASACASLAMFLVAQPMLGTLGANALALSATFVANTWAMVHFTAQRSRPDWLAAATMFVAALLLSSGALVALVAASAGLAAQVAAVAATAALLAVVRVAVLRRGLRVDHASAAPDTAAPA